MIPDTVPNRNACVWTREEIFPSVFGQGTDFVEDIIKAMRERNWSDRDHFAVNLSVVEAITNAIDHGNNCDPLKNVMVACKVSDDSVWVSVQDEGEGFSRDSIPDPTTPDFIELPGGRGIMLIHAFMTKVTFNETGNLIIMEKLRSPEV